jgi:hypothetical protein
MALSMADLFWPNPARLQPLLETHAAETVLMYNGQMLPKGAKRMFGSLDSRAPQGGRVPTKYLTM